MRLFAALLMVGCVYGGATAEMPLYEGPPPGATTYKQSEKVTLTKVGREQVRVVSNVTSPTLTAYLPPAGMGTGAAVVICPGGGFKVLSMDHEGARVAEWLNSIGVAAFVLKYRVAETGDVAADNVPVLTQRMREVAPLAVNDAFQAMRMVRARAAEWRIDPRRIGIMGFSAGGYVATAVAMTGWMESRPDFAAVLYPGVPDDPRPDPGAPPLFIVAAQDDKGVPPQQNAVRLANVWRGAGVPTEIHLYQKGGHGFGMLKRNLPVDEWTGRMRSWMDGLGMLRRGPAPVSD